MTLHPIPLNFLIYEENFLFFFITAKCLIAFRECAKFLRIRLRMRQKFFSVHEEYAFKRIRRKRQESRMQIRKKWLNQLCNFYNKRFKEHYLASFAGESHKVVKITVTYRACTVHYIFTQKKE